MIYKYIEIHSSPGALECQNWQGPSFLRTCKNQLKFTPQIIGLANLRRRPFIFSPQITCRITYLNILIYTMILNGPYRADEAGLDGMCG